MVKEKTMLYYGSYRLGDGTWQTTMIFKERAEAIKVIIFHAKGRDYIIAETEEDLERRKKGIKSK